MAGKRILHIEDNPSNRKAVRHILKQTVQGLRDANGQLRTLADAARRAVPEQAFGWFLLAWHQGRTAEAQAIADELAGSPREHDGAMFLLDVRPLPAKVEAFRQEHGEKEPTFVQYVIGEHHLRDGSLAEALACFRAAHRLTTGASEAPAPVAGLDLGGWLAERIRYRLDALRRLQGTGTQPAEGQ